MKTEKIHKKKIDVLFIEDSPNDVELSVRILEREFSVDKWRVDTSEDLEDILEKKSFDLVLCDYTMPTLMGDEALRLFRSADSETPFIFLSGTIGEEKAVSLMKSGAQDYVMKTNVNRLLPAVERELNDAKTRRDRSKYQGMLDTILCTAPDAILATDVHGIVTYVNNSARQIFGYSSDEMIGRHLSKVVQVADGLNIGKMPVSLETLRSLSDRPRGEKLCWPLQGCRNDGSLFPVDVKIANHSDADGIVYTLIIRDQSERMVLEKKLDHLAHHDELTGLCNRRLLVSRLEQNIELSNRNGTCVMLALLDLDEFKRVNDSFGHAWGDELLKQVANRYREVVRKSDTVARLGGDEFAIIVSDIESSQRAMRVAAKIVQALNEPIRIFGKDFKVDASIGISQYPSDGKSIETLMRNADIALFRAKNQVRKALVFYQDWMTSLTSEDISLENDLKEAINNNHLSLFYQPIIDLESRKVVAAEALLRWKHPVRGEVSPTRFIPIAEASGLIVPLGEQVLEIACKQLLAWRGKGFDISLNVNLSARQFHEEEFVDQISQIVNRFHVPAEWLTLEITESVLMLSERIDAGKALASLKEMGFKVALDDFGTGYSSLTYLKRYPVDYLKIDRSFISELPDNKLSNTIVRAMIAMAQELDIKVVAEGVETDDQRKYLSLQGCHNAQGYLFSMPVSCESFEKLLNCN